MGVRVIYPETGETYTRSATWDGVQPESTIAIRVLPTNLAYVLAVGVAGGQAKWYRIPAALHIPEGGTVSLELVETPPEPATWRCADSTCDEALSGSVEATGDELTLAVDVADPFQIGESPSWGSLLIRVSGKVTGPYPNASGWRRFTVLCERKDGNMCRFQPYVSGPMFGLGEDYIAIPPVVPDFYVRWAE